jgi:rubredoxin
MRDLITIYGLAELGQMTKWKCSICGWEYDHEQGLPKKNIAPGTSFENLPDDFKCPKCGATKKWFIDVRD